MEHYWDWWALLLEQRFRRQAIVFARPAIGLDALQIFHEPTVSFNGVGEWICSIRASILTFIKSLQVDIGRKTFYVENRTTTIQ